jgi:exocyst complex protein 7
MDQSGSELHKRMEALSLQASALRDALQRSEENTDSAVAALDSFDRHVSAIEASIRPVQVRPPLRVPVRRGRVRRGRDDPCLIPPP